MHFELTIETPHGMIQAEIRILYLWPDAGILTPALSLVRLGKGKMMGWTIIGISNGWAPRLPFPG
jgi:hypothetical protein